MFKILFASKVLTLSAAFLYATYAYAAPDPNLCSELSGYFLGDKKPKLADPSRKPTEAETRLIDEAKIESLESTDYANGVFIIDADNDGKEDVFAWTIQGSGRFASAELFDFSAQAGNDRKLVPKTTLDGGILQEPRFVRFKGVNYFIITETGDDDGLVVSRIAKAEDGRYENQTLCRMHTVVKPETSCKHPACIRLKELIEDKNENAPFVNVEWPHKYFPPAGLTVYFSEDWTNGDIDNTHNATSIWRIGRDGYMNQHIYWALLGQGQEMPIVDPKLRPLSEDRQERRVLPGHQHDRLRRTLAQQSEVLSRELHRQVSLPNEGEFFLFNAHEDRTYWAWDLGSPPYGEEIHIMYTNAKKSDYIGVIRTKRTQLLEPCATGCITSLSQ